MIQRPVFLMIALMAMVLGGCSTVSTPHANTGQVTSEQGVQISGSELALIRNASMVIEVEEPSGAASAASGVAEELGGHALSMGTNRDRSVSLTLRVPSDRLDEAMEEFASLGEVKSQSIRAQDVTVQLTDSSARLGNLVAVRDRLRSHLDRANNVNEIISLERELARVQGEIDMLESRLANLQSQVALSRVDLTLERKIVLGPVAQVFSGANWVLGKLFVWN